MGAGFFGGSALQRSTLDAGRGLPKCGICKFAPQCDSPRMEVGGRGKLPVLVVGEIPGVKEDQLGKHFAGLSGARLRDSFKEIGQDLRDCHLTYSMICRAPKGRAFSDVNINACRPTLLKTIDTVKPKVIILLGPATVRSLVPTERGGSVGAFDRWVGHAIPSAQYGAWLCPTYSPAHMLRMNEDPVLLKLWHQHLARAFKLTERKPVAYSMKELWAHVETITSPRLARLRLKDLARKSGRCAFDYEANCLKPDRKEAKLLAVSFCLEGKDTFSLLIKNQETLDSISKVLRNPKLRMIASNMKNEERWTKAKMGHYVANWWWDTMVAAHVLDQRKGITSIKFQAFLYFGVPDYDRFVERFMEEDPRNPGYNTLDKMDTKDLLNYNGLDSLLEFMVAEKQQQDMGLDPFDPKEWLK